MKDIVNNLSDEEFEKYRQSVKINIMEKDTSLYQECSKYWLEIEKHRYMFDRSNLYYFSHNINLNYYRGIIIGSFVYNFEKRCIKLF